MNKVGGTESLSNLLRNTQTETGRASYQSLLNSTALYLFGVNLIALHQDLLLFPLLLSHAKVTFYWLMRVIYQPLHQFSSVIQSCPTLCNPMNCSMPGLPVHQQLLVSSQTHVHRVGDAIQPSHPLSSPSPPALNLSQHRGLFKWVSSSYQVAKVLEFQLQHESFQWKSRADLLQNGLVGSLCIPRGSQESSPIPQFKSINSLALSFL